MGVWVWPGFDNPGVGRCCLTPVGEDCAACSRWMLLLAGMTPGGVVVPTGGVARGVLVLAVIRIACPNFALKPGDVPQPWVPVPGPWQPPRSIHPRPPPCSAIAVIAKGTPPRPHNVLPWPYPSPPPPPPTLQVAGLHRCLRRRPRQRRQLQLSSSAGVGAQGPGLRWGSAGAGVHVMRRRPCV